MVRKEQELSLTETYPFGWPVNLSHNIVTRFMVPHDWKWAWISSGEAP